MRLGLIAIGRPTFDIPYAQSVAQTAAATLRGAGIDIVGAPTVHTTLADVTTHMSTIDGVDAVVVLQASFADSTLVGEVAASGILLVLWGFPEERTGGRLRLNSLCGINLAGYALSNIGVRYGWVYAEPNDVHVPSRISETVTADSYGTADPAAKVSVDPDVAKIAAEVVAKLRSTTIGLVGKRPDGFEPCGYEATALASIFGVTVDEVVLPELFDRASAALSEQVTAVRTRAATALIGLDDVDQEALDRSLRIHSGLRSLIDEGGWAGVATRCWPETFTEFGGAACTPMALLNDYGTPGVCEADVYGNVTALVLQWLSHSAAFVADLVHLESESNTGVLWHCGLAPLEMADPGSVPRATIHSNREKPLLSEFPLKPGRVTIARISTSRGQHRVVVGGGEMLEAPLAFSGTAGVVRFDNSVASVLDTVLGEGLEHHFGVVYGDVRDELRAIAAELELPIVEI